MPGNSRCDWNIKKYETLDSNVCWAQKVGINLTSGLWQIVVTASLSGKTESSSIYFTV